MNYYSKKIHNPFLIKNQQIVIFAFLGLCFLLFFNISNGITNIIIKCISDAYIQVSSFVAGTLLIFFSLEKFFKIDIGTLLKKHHKLEVVLASSLGALPGCGGAIIVLTQYIRGKVSFGSVVATLTATMGDAAFLLLAKEPETGLLILLIGFVVGTISGLLVNCIHNKSFLRPTGCDIILSNTNHKTSHTPKKIEKLWMFLMIPGIFLGIISAFQVDLDFILYSSFLEKPITFYGFIAGSLCLVMWILPILSGQKYRPSSNSDSIIKRTISDTNFITGWVILAFIVFETTVFLTNIDLKSLFNSYIFYAPIIAILIGFLPGCGPQILITTLYLNGIIPLSAQIGNAIANDGDALFPAIAIHPKAALIATLYSAIPAIIVSYIYLFFLEI